MGQQHNKTEKRRRRKTYLKRIKEREANGQAPRRKAAKADARSGDEVKKKVAAKKKVVKKKAVKGVEAAPASGETPAATES